MQLNELFPKFDKLHSIYGSKVLTSIYGAGKIKKPNICLIFMNPTVKNVSAVYSWKGIRAPWIGTKNIWKLLNTLGLFNNTLLLNKIQSMRPEEWTWEFAENLYKDVVKESLYITNIAKCTQDDARHLPDSVYKEYLPLMIEELEYIKPKIVFALGNQVNSILLQRPISVSKYTTDEYEILTTPHGLDLRIYPSYYPIGQGSRNMSKAIKRITKVLEVSKI